MKKTIVWGVGKMSESLLINKKILFKEREIIAFVDNNRNKWLQTFHGLPIFSPDYIQNLIYDEIIVSSKLYEDEIVNQIVNELGINKEKIILNKDLDKEFCNNIIQKYENTSNVEIREIIEYYKEKGFNIFGKYVDRPRKPYYVQRESDGMPYIMFEGKRMYYPKDRKFTQEDGKEIIYDVLYEQLEGSPHLYIRDDSDIIEGAVMVDAGVCEGNFALRYIDKVSKLYLIEANPIWIEPLKRTFAPYSSKVVMCDKFLGRQDTSDTIRLDTLVNEKIDFLKMYIEGAEIDSLIGAKNVLSKSNAKCAICSYHRQYDEQDIKFILSNLGYDCETSKGYMFFIYDSNIYETMDFRRGIVYAKKKHEE